MNYPGVKGDWIPGTTRVDVDKDGDTFFSGISTDGQAYIAKQDRGSTAWHNPVRVS